jgi:hypothetical protein
LYVQKAKKLETQASWGWRRRRNEGGFCFEETGCSSKVVPEDRGYLPSSEVGSNEFFKCCSLVFEEGSKAKVVGCLLF